MNGRELQVKATVVAMEPVTYIRSRHPSTALRMGQSVSQQPSPVHRPSIDDLWKRLSGSFAEREASRNARRAAGLLRRSELIMFDTRQFRESVDPRVRGTDRAEFHIVCQTTAIWHNQLAKRASRGL
jgi:hypothetical protein